MNNETLNDNDTQNFHSGDKGEKGIYSYYGYEKLWDKLKEDLGLLNIILLFLGSILLIFSPEKGWGFDIPYIDYTLAYRGWLGILCFVLVLIFKFIIKKRNGTSKDEKKVINSEQKTSEPNVFSQKKITSENANTKSEILFKSMYIHFSKDKYNDLSSMCTQLFLCNDYSSAMLLLINFQRLFNGKLYFSPFVQTFTENKLITKKGEGDKKWCWWYWDGGVEGFQLIISLCQ